MIACAMAHLRLAAGHDAARPGGGIGHLSYTGVRNPMELRLRIKTVRR